MKAVKYINSKPDIVEFVEGLDAPNVVKKTISYISKSINSKFRKHLAATAYVLSRRDHEMSEITEGEEVWTFMMPMDEENMKAAIHHVNQFLECRKDILELVLVIRKTKWSSVPNSFGIGFVDYYDPENW